MTDYMPFEEGTVYDTAPRKPIPKPPDIHSFFEAAGVPDTSEGLPKPIEWYEKAKERQAERDREIEVLNLKKADLRTEWTEIALAELAIWTTDVENVIVTKRPLGLLQSLLARARHERPGDKQLFEELLDANLTAVEEQDRLAQELRDVCDRLKVNTVSVITREEADKVIEQKRLLEREKELKKKRRQQRLLDQNEALIRGEDPPPLDTDEEAELDKDEASRPASKEWDPSQRPMSAQLAVEADVLSAVPVRGGLASQLPPIPDPPAAPTLLP